MGYKVNPPSAEELRQMAQDRMAAPGPPGAAGMSVEQANKLLEEVAISKIEIEIQNVYLQDTCARLDVALNEVTDLYDFAPIGFVRTDAEGKISKLNLAGAGLLGAERNVLMGRAFVDFFFPDQRSRIQALMRRALDSGEDQHCDVTLGGANRMLQHVQLSLSPLYTVRGHHVVMSNITARRALEEDLRANIERWKCAMQATGDGLWEWDVRSDSLQLCPRLASLYGKPAEPVGRVLDSWRERVHPQDWPRLLENFQQCLGGSEASFSSEHRSLHSNGQWVWTRCQGTVFSRDADGRVLRMVGTDTDISAGRRLQEECQEAMGIQQSLFQLLPQYLAVLDADGRVLRTNALWNALGLASGHAYRNGFCGFAYADVLDAVTGAVEQTKARALAGIADVLAAKVPLFQLEYSFGAGAQQRCFIMHVMAVQGARARAVVSHQDVSRLKGQVAAPAH